VLPALQQLATLTRNMKKLIVLFLYLSLCSFAKAQVNTPAGATWPFGSRIDQFPTNPYPFGLIPTNLPTGAYNPASNLYGKSQDAYDAYVEWKNCYGVNCGGGQWRIRFDNASQTVSEGIAYGMLLAAYAADKTFFDGLWAYYKARVNGRGLMNWRIDNPSATTCGNTASGSNGAADSEVDAAMALIIAECQWPTATSPYDYAAEANYLISRIRQWEIPTACATGNMQLSNGDGWVVGCPANNDCRNPSYQSPAYFKHYQAFDGGAPAGFWNTVTTNTYTMLNANRNTTTGLVSNWCSPAGVANTCGTPAFNDHGYDAIRNPWRMATDYIWWGETQTRTNFTQPISNYVRTTLGGAPTFPSPTNLRGPVTLAGATIGGRTTAAPDATFTSMWGVATMGVDFSTNNQQTLDFMYTRVKNVKDPLNCTAGSSSGYFGNTLRVVALFMMTGNFWKPCPPRCQAPAFAADSISTCGPNSVTLNSGLPTATGRTFQWFKNNVSLGAASSSATTLIVNATSPAPNGPGWFKVKVDTTGGCSRTDSIYVSSTAITPDLGPAIQLCKPSSVTLNSGILGTGYTFIWEYSSTGSPAGLAVIPGESNSTLTNVRRPGLYRVTATKAGCTSKSATIMVTSLLASPQDACRSTAPGSVTLSVIGPNLGPATNYDWYSVASGGTILSGGTGTYNYATPSLAAGTYTYYIQDKSKVYGAVGKAAPTSPPATCGFSAMNNDGVTAGWGIDNYNVYHQNWTVSKTIDIDSVTVYYCLWSNAMPAITFQLQTGAGTIVTTTPSRPGIRIVNPVGTYSGSGNIQGVRYYVGITGVAPGTYRLRATAGTNGVPAGSAGNMLLEQHPTNVSYAYNDNLDGATASITSSFGYSTTFFNRYAHFYDWTISTMNSCDRIPVYAYIGSCPASLPVTLVNFTGKYDSGVVKLEWNTGSEKDASHFDIERSADGENFVKIGKVNAAGNSTRPEYYTFLDPEPLNGISYYRLVVVDNDGKSAAGNVIAIEKESPGITVFPNPSSGEITIAMKETGEKISCLTITDILGKEILSLNNEFSVKTIDISSLPEGTYIITACHSQGYHAVRFVKKGK
jgi:endo-1,4-beta-D-glucanase Y